MSLRSWALLIVICMLPRAIGLSINREANDDHIQVVELWIAQGRYPDEKACWECFQPPLYSALQYAIARPLDLHDRTELICVAHAINFALSVAILLLLAKQINQFDITAKWKMLLFVFVAMNPKLIVINMQATNDTLLIAIGMALLDSLCRLPGRFDATSLSIVWLLAFAAAITKGNGLVLLFGTCGIVTVLVSITSSVNYFERTAILGLFLISLPVLSFEIGFYSDHYRQNGTPFSINQEKAPPAQLISFDEYQGKRLGVRSIADCFLTFRLLNLLEYPSLNGDGLSYPEHRTSFWTLLYGQAFHAQFENYPLSWRTSRFEVNWLARGLYVLGLCPFGMLLAGTFIQLRQRFVEFGQREWRLLASASILPLFFFAFLLFLVKYSIDYRDFANIKVIFLFPAIPAFVSFISSAIRQMSGRPIESVAAFVFAVICVGFVSNVALLLFTLWCNPS